MFTLTRAPRHTPQPVPASPSPRRMRPRTVLAVTTAAAVVLAPASTAGAAWTSAEPALNTQVNALMTDYRVQRATVGSIVLDGATGAEIHARGAWRPLAPASNMKSITAAAAMNALGPGFRWSTSVFATKAPVNGVLSGNLHLKGYGDPTLLESDLISLARQVRAKGITKVTGDLVYDAYYFDNDRYHSDWASSYADEYYAPQISGLTLAPNTDYDVSTVIVNYRPSSYGRPAILTTTPASATRHVKIVNKTTTSSAGTGSTISVTRTPGTSTITVTGRIASNRAGSRTWVTVDDPARYAGQIFRAALKREGVSVLGALRRGGTPWAGRRRLAHDTSVPLSQALPYFMKLSNNGHGEHLLKTMGRRASGKSGSWANGREVVTQFLASSKVATTGVVLRDGSGLSTANRLPARTVAQVLQYARSQPWFGAYYDSMPVAGVADRWIGGTLKSRMDGTVADGNVHAKTGSLPGVTALGGYARGANGKSYTFVMISKYSYSSPRPVEDKLAILLAGWRG